MTDFDKLRARRLPVVDGKPDVRWEGSWLRPGDRVKSERWDDLGTVTNDWEQWERGLLGVAVAWDVGDRPGVGSLLDWQGRLSLVEPAPDDENAWIDTATEPVLRSKLRAVIAERDRYQSQRDKARKALKRLRAQPFAERASRGEVSLVEPAPDEPERPPWRTDHGAMSGVWYLVRDDESEQMNLEDAVALLMNEREERLRVFRPIPNVSDYPPPDAVTLAHLMATIRENDGGNLDIGGGDVKVESSTLELPTVEAIAEQIHEEQSGPWGDEGVEYRKELTQIVEQVVGPWLSQLAEAQGARDMAFAQIADDGTRIAELEQWKREATEVIAEWDAIYDSVADESSDLGRTRASVVAQRLVESERQCWEMATRAGDRDRRIAELEAEQPEWTDAWRNRGKDFINIEIPGVKYRGWQPVQVAIRPRPDEDET